MGQIASGVPATGQVHLADMNGDGLDDYLVVADNAWIDNGGDPA